VGLRDTGEPTACRRCFASLFMDRAISYRIGNGFDHIKVALSVGIMKMVGSDRAATYPFGRVTAKRSFEERMNMLKIPHHALVFVGDGRKALFLRNDGDATFPKLTAEKVFEDENPPTHEQGSDRPGRLTEAALTGRRSAVEPTDWHDIEEHRFVRKVAAAMEQMVRTSRVKALIVVAPPKTLAELRNAFHPDVKACVVAEIDKDLTKHPVREIEKHLMSDA
jgi:protein required for attachment to host cells